jgi:hypothetical protein
VLDVQLCSTDGQSTHAYIIVPIPSTRPRQAAKKVLIPPILILCEYGIQCLTLRNNDDKIVLVGWPGCVYIADFTVLCW